MGYVFYGFYEYQKSREYVIHVLCAFSIHTMYALDVFTGIWSKDFWFLGLLALGNPSPLEGGGLGSMFKLFLDTFGLHIFGRGLVAQLGNRGHLWGKNPFGRKILSFSVV